MTIEEIRANAPSGATIMDTIMTTLFIFMLDRGVIIIAHQII